MLAMIKSINLALAFFLELCLLTALGYWGFRTGYEWIIKIVLGIGVPAVVIAIWGLFLAPTSSLRLHNPWLLLARIALFGAATAALVAAGRPILGWVLAALFAANSILVIAWD
jgi:hypothetical protein